MPEQVPEAFKDGPLHAGDPARDGADVTPSNVDALPDGTCRSLYIGTGGDVKVTTRKGTVLTFKNLGSGSLLPLQIQKVWGDPDTTAEDMIALY